MIQSSDVVFRRGLRLHSVEGSLLKTIKKTCVKSSDAFPQRWRNVDCDMLSLTTTTTSCYDCYDCYDKQLQLLRQAATTATTSCCNLPYPVTPYHTLLPHPIIGRCPAKPKSPAVWAWLEVDPLDMPRTPYRASKKKHSTTHHALSPPLPRHHVYIIHLINRLHCFYRITMSLKWPLVTKNDCSILSRAQDIHQSSKPDGIYSTD